MSSKNTVGGWATYLMNFMSISISDQLYLNYQPQTQFTVQSRNSSVLFSTSIKAYTSNNTVFAFMPYYPAYSGADETLSYNVHNLSITRYSLAYIIGSYLSWISILTMIFGFIVAPIMDASLNLILIQTLFHIEPQMEKPSIIRFIIASVKSKLFLKEDKFVKLN